MKQWLQNRVRVDFFGLNAPKSQLNHNQPPSSALDMQASSFKIVEKDGKGPSSSLTIETTFPFQVLYRFNKDCKYTDIPRGKAESVLCSLMASLTDTPECVDPDIVTINASGEVVVYEEQKGDWLLSLMLNLEVTFKCEIQELYSLQLGIFAP